MPSLANPLQGSAAATLGTKYRIAGQVFFSIGPAGDYQTLNGIHPAYLTIESGIGTFSVDQTNPDLTVGDKVSFVGGGEVYLKRKLTRKKWLVINEIGGVPADRSHDEIDSISCPFNSLNAAIDGATPGIYSLIGSYDLVDEDIRVNLVCKNFTDTTGVVINNLWTVDAERYINIYAPYKKDECNSKQRHGGRWDTGYTMNTASGSINVQQPYTTIEGLRVTTSDAVTGVIYCSQTAAYSKIIGNVVKDGANDGIHHRDDTTTLASTRYIVNNTVYDCGRHGINYGHDLTVTADKYAYIYDNTVRGCAGAGIYLRNSATAPTYAVYLKNNLCEGNTGLAYDMNNP